MKTSCFCLPVNLGRETGGKTDKGTGLIPCHKSPLSPKFLLNRAMLREKRRLTRKQENKEC
ncbi:hypothetical protein KDH_79420 [Dictyobacter sp. S3.2.2.5]|uniref:Uncharacterized protein n=1 Tax=Dictyobacter halimunensis TaxID=3026934 RepID=A0ABQ6G8I4_9CHLR|nr:hypothetical protein KDH_79420 [Dictyobacter sp. S3.2.2.5]